MKKTVIAGDFHIPQEEKEIINSFCKFLKKEKPEILVINGDFLDFYDLSFFDKDFTDEGLFQEELDKGFNLLKRFRTILPNSEIVMTKSNHMDKRLEKFKKTLGKALYSLRYFTIKQMLKLDELDINLVQQHIAKKYIVEHGNLARKHSAYSAKAMLEDRGKSVFMNHTHRLGSHYKSDDGANKVGVECGCMCKLNPKYIDNKPNWQQGFCIIYEESVGNFYHYLIPIINNKFIWGGIEYK